MEVQGAYERAGRPFEHALVAAALEVLRTCDGEAGTLVDQDLHAETRKFYSWVGTPGQLINSYADLTKAPQRLDEMGVEMVQHGSEAQFAWHGDEPITVAFPD